ncbi:hypothetical protein CHARACLAT_010104 [Characodon lateralis]|uniref:Uncharacterized protein n=1 Tax=Characodon lateralis TaxID=208331 RepID=A0ABU7E3E2_9TELE|nr:hypothetical protein [Characodon lateralis]
MFSVELLLMTTPQNQTPKTFLGAHHLMFAKSPILKSRIHFCMFPPLWDFIWTKTRTGGLVVKSEVFIRFLVRKSPVTTAASLNNAFLYFGTFAYYSMNGSF